MRAAVPIGILAAAFAKEEPPSPFYPYYEAPDDGSPETDYEATFVAVAQHLEQWGYREPEETAAHGQGN